MMKSTSIQVPHSQKKCWSENVVFFFSFGHILVKHSQLITFWVNSKMCPLCLFYLNLFCVVYEKIVVEKYLWKKKKKNEPLVKKKNIEPNFGPTYAFLMSNIWKNAKSADLWLMPIPPFWHFPEHFPEHFWMTFHFAETN